MKTNKKIIWVLLGVVLVLTSGCLGDFYDNDSDAVKSSKLVLAIIFDQSKSAKNIYPFTRANIDSMLYRVKRSGGEIFWLAINGEEPKVNRVAFKENALPALNLASESKCRSGLLELCQNREANLSRVFESLELAIRFLQEPHHDPRAEYFLLIISDFEEDYPTGPPKHILTLPSGVSCLTIGAHPDRIAEVLTGEIYYFTTADAAIEFLTKEKKHGRTKI